MCLSVPPINAPSLEINTTFPHYSERKKTLRSSVTWSSIQTRKVHHRCISWVIQIATPMNPFVPLVQINALFTLFLFLFNAVFDNKNPVSTPQPQPKNVK
ncbi:hypothetical protein J3459_016443 [Metarhizium acridum]|uniref:uncharacterized protein n=1 Tax=Metarhizium acridum TaxID=92637 RepID=UPI001C6CDE91|nr:hypothetical protein J3458_020648 [Metarhizium acridum]KAG8411293.1 hypothetical protein J3459_016443 [Metarhizium acridum]